MRPMIHSTKYFVQTTLSTITTGAKLDITFIRAVAVVDKNLNIEVEEGASVKAVWVEMWITGSTINQFFTIILAKLPSNLDPASTVELADLNSWEGKKNILYTTQGLAPSDANSAPVPILRQWFKIPKSKQRFGLGDELVLTLMSRGDADIILCGNMIYKEYT